MFTRVGKKQMMPAMAILGSMPLPSSSTRIGALATTGMVLTMTAMGNSASSAVLRQTNTVARLMAAKLPSRKPSTASIAVGSRLLISMSKRCTSTSATAIGDGAMNGLMSKISTACHHTSRNSSTAAIGSSRRRQAR